MTRRIVSAVLRTVAGNWSPTQGHYHVAAAGRTVPCADPACRRRTAAR